MSKSNGSGGAPANRPQRDADRITELENRPLLTPDEEATIVSIRGRYSAGHKTRNRCNDLIKRYKIDVKAAKAYADAKEQAMFEEGEEKAKTVTSSRLKMK